MGRVVWSLLFLAGCMRGCNLPSCASGGGGGRDLRCATTDDCEGAERCREGICLDPASIAAAERCLGTPECKDHGACRPGLTRSFLGASSQPTCLVERDEDCAASALCTSQGRCALRWTEGTYRDGYCGPATAKHCAASTRCASHDECTLAERDCARVWEGCTGERLPGFPGETMLGAPWQPGELADALVACRVEDDYKQTTSFVRAGGTCMPGPRLGADTPFVLRTRLAVGDRIEVAIQADPKRGTYRDAGYVRASYRGSSPFASEGAALPKLTCTVVPPEAAQVVAAGLVTRLDKGLVRLHGEHVDAARLVDEPAEARGIRRVLGEAAPWLGSDPRHAKLQAALELELVRWRSELDAAIRALVPAATGPKSSLLRVEGFVCGAALTKRGAGDHGDEDCGVEVRVHATEPIRLGGAADFYALELARPGPQATVTAARIVDVRPPPAASVLAAGEEAIMLLVPERFFPLAGARLIGRLDFAGKQRFVLPLDR